MSAENKDQDARLRRRRQHSRSRLQRWTWLLDDVVRIPIINMRVGLDAVVGLVPVIGDFAGVAFSSVLFAEAVRLRAPRSVLMRMGRNMVADFALGLLPVIGDVFDVAWRANRRNLRTLETWLDEEQQEHSRSRWPAALIGLALLASAAPVCWLFWRAIFG